MLRTPAQFEAAPDPAHARFAAKIPSTGRVRQ
jgi:hypothetical protein